MPRLLRALLFLTPFLVAGLFLSLPRLAAGTGEQFRGELTDWGANPWPMSASLGGTFVYVSGQITATSDLTSTFKFFKDSDSWYGNGAGVSVGAIATGFSTAGGDSYFVHLQNLYYAVKWNGNDKAVIFRLGGPPAIIDAVTAAPALVTNTDSPIITATLSTSLVDRQGAWLRYTTDNFASSSVVQMSGSGATYTATIPAQSTNTTVRYYLFTSGVGTSIAPGDADLMTINYNNNGGSNYSYTVLSDATPSGARALWLDRTTLAWNGAAGSSYRLLFDTGDGEIASLLTAASLALTDTGAINGSSYPKNPNANGLKQLTLGDTGAISDVLRSEVVVAAYNSGGAIIDASRVQLQSVLDELYAAQAVSQTLGVHYTGAVPTVQLWAPTARSVTLLRFADPTTALSTSHSMTMDPASGVWSVAGDAGWDRQYYLFDVEVYVAALDQVVHNLVTDPYAITLSPDDTTAGDVRSQFVNLADADLKPAGWDNVTKPALSAPEDMAVYEVHVRDFSINDTSVLTGTDRGTFRAFTYDGNGGRPLSNGMDHLQQLQAAGLTHIHLLPVFDIASVAEVGVARTPTPNPTGFARDSDQPQTVISNTRATDSFNWGYDPYHYGAVEGSYASDPGGVARIVEFREMIQRLNENGLRVVMDVVYNHTAQVGQEEKSVLDKIVPGYYYRYAADGTLATSSCCADTASEYAMMEDLMIDTVVRWATAYKVDGFRFDLMNLHTRQNMRNVQSAVQALTVANDGVEGDEIYLYGEGWDFGSALAKGLTACPHCYAKQYNMTGTGIGTFNDVLRDAAHGGYSTDTVQIRKQGFINGLSYDWNGVFYDNRFQSDLWNAMSLLRRTLAGSGSLYTDDPQETINYVEKHDNETLFDQNVFKLPGSVTMAERVRAQNMGASLVGLAQGIPFFQMGQDILRSKSLDRNSYDSGDWFNKVDWSYGNNNFGVGLPPAWDNQSRWGVMGPLLQNTALDPATADMGAGAAHLRETLRLRKSSPLFRLPTEAAANAQVSFYNTGATPQDGLIVMALSDNGVTDLDATVETILVFFNANKITQTFTIANANGFALHPLQADAVDADPVVQTAAFVDATDTFTIPARTTAVFVSGALLLAPSSIDFVGLLYPRGGVVTLFDEGAFSASGFDVYVQVYDTGITDGAGQGTGIACSLHWGRYGDSWSDVAMSYNGDIGNNDEYRATLSQAVLNGLAAGSYGFTAYCQRTGEEKKWKQDGYDINSNPLDDDQGDGRITVIPAADSSSEPAGGVFVHLFEWKWSDVAKECVYLGEKGYTGVQVSPPMEHVPPVADMGSATADYPWWVRYQPVTHDATKLESRSGTPAEFQSMVSACNAAGVAVIVDAVINHTTGVGSGTGTAGSTYTGYSYPQYAPGDFHACGSAGNDILDYKDRHQVQTCELANLADLNTGNAGVQATLHTYLQDLLDLGVKGFRIDAAKHIAAEELATIFDGLTLIGGGRPYIFQEVIDQDTSERIRDGEYTPNGDVTEFGYSVDLGYYFNAGDLSALQTITGSLMPSRFAVVFTDNHDNQRGHGAGGAYILDHRDGNALYNLGNIFMLAYPYGHPSVMSSYYWSSDPNSNAGDSKGPPSTTPPYISGSGAATRPVYNAGQLAGDVPANCAASFEDGKWVCEHRRTPIANMVAFRQATVGEPVAQWVTVSADHIAFARGDAGYVAINREAITNTRTYTTHLPAGYYCDIIRHDFSGGRCLQPGTTTPVAPAELVKVEADGQILGKTVAGMDAFAVHIDARLGQQNLRIDKAGTGDGTVTSLPAGVDCGLTCTASFDFPMVVTVTAAAAPGSTFNGWNGACSGTGVCPVTMTETQRVTATFTLNSYALLTATAGSGSGSVNLNPVNSPYAHGAVVTATTTAATGSTFAGWSGACSGSGPCVVTMDEAKAVTATFTLNSYALLSATAGSGNGSVSLNPANGPYAHGTAVTATATAATGSAFAGWSGACSGAGSCVITMGEAKTVTATFTLNSYALLTATTGSGSGSVNLNPANRPYAHGTVVTATATAATGSTFAGWSGACNGSGPCVVTMDEAKTVTATFTLNSYALLTATAGSGSGSVSLNPVNGPYAHGAVVTATATAATGSTFAGWSGACSGSGPCVVTMNEAKAVTATFTLNSYALLSATAGSGSGSVSLNPANGPYAHGAVVTATATAATGSTFAGWSGACSGAGSCVITMGEAKTVTATFTLNSYALLSATAGSGSGSVSLNPVNGPYAHGTVVTAAATAATGSTFAGWSGDCSGSGACVVTMDEAKAVTATFTLNSYALLSATAGGGSGSVSLNPVNSPYAHGTVVTATATAATGSAFAGWSGDCSGSGPCVVTMDEAKTVTATFTLNSYALLTATAGSGSGSVSLNPANGPYAHGTVVTATATAATGSTFAGWSGACSGSGPCIVTMDEAKTVTATFILNSYALLTATTGSGSGSVNLNPANGPYAHGTVVTATATAATGSTFAGWSGACSGSGPCVVTMDEAKTVTATFTLNSYALLSATAGSGSGSVSLNPANGPYAHGAVVTATATAATGSAFAGWSGDCSGSGPCVVTMNEAKAVTATFALLAAGLATSAQRTASGPIAAGDPVTWLVTISNTGQVDIILEEITGTMASQAIELSAATAAGAPQGCAVPVALSAGTTHICTMVLQATLPGAQLTFSLAVRGVTTGGRSVDDDYVARVEDAPAGQLFLPVVLGSLQ